MDDLKEIVARALQRSGFKADERDAADLIDALRDPPASVIEAGAKAMWIYRRPHLTVDEWPPVDPNDHESVKLDFLDVWRAALGH